MDSANDILVDARANIKQQTWTVGPFHERSSLNFGQISTSPLAKRQRPATQEEKTYLE